MIEWKDGRILKLMELHNLRVKDETGDVSGAAGHGATIEEALKDTIVYFLGILSEKEFLV